ncbi:MAG: hypothetical protein HGB10_06635 [Coriobacteriia bacterium]|nr:hypothetical protein [Coriobacteriia bacterium]
MSYQPSEIADLVLLLALGPVIVASFRRTKIVLPAAVYAAFAAMICGYTFTILEGFWLSDVFNLLEHASYAVAGVAFLVGIVRLRRSMGPGGEVKR